MLVAGGDAGTLPAGAPVAVKEAVMPFHRFRRPDGTGVDTILGPEMRSTGEVMGIDAAFGPAFAKSQTGSYGSLPTSGTVFVSVANRDKRAMVFPIKRLADIGFTVVATTGTAEMLRRNGINATVVRKHFEGAGNVVEMIRAGEIDLVINTPFGQSGPRIDGYEIRTAAVATDIPCITTVAGAHAAIQGIEALVKGGVGVASLQNLQARLRSDVAADLAAREPKVVAVLGVIA
jgi:carbamoyl-phosphate synthase large subunit